MIIGLAENANSSPSDFNGPSSGHVRIYCKQEPAFETAFRDHLWVQHILPTMEVFIVNDEAKTSYPQCGGENLGPEVAVQKEDRIRRQST